MNGIIEVNVEEARRSYQCDGDWNEADLDQAVEEEDIAAAISDAHDDPC